MKSSPTSGDRGAQVHAAAKTAAQRDPESRRLKSPDLFVRLSPEHPWDGPHLAKAHLRNKRGYVYLVWRDGSHVHEFYIGKAKRPYTTWRARGKPARRLGPAGRRSGAQALVLGKL